MATQRPVSGLVLESTATSVKALVEILLDKKVPWYEEPFVSVRYDPIVSKANNVEQLKKYDGPLLILAGGNDTLTTADMARSLIAHSATPKALKMLVIVPGAQHAQIMHPPYVQHVYKAYEQFIQTVVKHASAKPVPAAPHADSTSAKPQPSH